MNRTAPSHAFVDLNAYAHNLGVITDRIGQKTGIIAVVKANAYGHGLAPVAKKAVECGVRMLAVATVNEGIELRRQGVVAPVLVMVQPEAGALAAAIEQRLTLMVSDVATAELIGEIAQRTNRVVSIHCKVDTGMGRQGFAVATAAEQIQYLTRISHIDIEGIGTHFPTAYLSDDAFTYSQIKAFRHLLKLLEKAGIPYETTHAANSAAVFNYPASHFDMVRAGLATYGIWPTDSPPVPGLLKPVLRWQTRITQVREFPPGTSIGYGRTFTTTAPLRGAILPVGYADGYQHALSNRADVLIHGQRCPVRGSVCMDQIMVDVTHLGNIHPGTVATLIGSDGKEAITVEELAVRADTIPYEIVANIGPRVPREYV